MIAMPSPAHVVLVVEDEPILRLNAAEALKDAGCEAFEAAGSQEALDILSEHPEILVLFTDINMPGERDGLALAEVVHQRWPGIRLIHTSGREQPAPADIPDDGQFIAKPYHLDVITNLIVSLPRS